MKKIFNITLLGCILAVSGCGDDQAEQKASPATSATPQAPAVKAETSKEATKIQKPQWAVLEQNVYHYPE